jgi:hypothetical protein
MNQVSPLDSSQITDEERERVRSAIPALLAHDASHLLRALEHTLRRHLTLSEWSIYEGMSLEDKRAVLETVADQFPTLAAARGKLAAKARSGAARR